MVAPWMMALHPLVVAMEGERTPTMPLLQLLQLPLAGPALGAGQGLLVLGQEAG